MVSRLPRVPVLGVATAAACALHAVVTLAGGGEAATAALALATYALATATIAQRSRRHPAWRPMALGMAAYAAGEVASRLVLGAAALRHAPNAADLLWLAFYPLTLASVVRVVADRLGGMPAGLRLDGLTAALTIAVLAALAFEPVVRATGGSDAAVATALGCPTFDLALVLVVVAACATTGWRPGAGWLLIGAALALWFVADCRYVATKPAGTYDQHGPLAIAWTTGTTMMALGVWLPPTRHRPGQGDWRSLLVPAAGTAVAAAVLLQSALLGRHLVAALLAAAVLACATARTVLTVREVRALLAARERDRTDPLTGLLTERGFGDAAEARLARAGGRPHVLLHIGFDDLRDVAGALGHELGDAVLRAHAQRLRALDDGVVVGRHGAQYLVLAAARPALLGAVHAALVEPVHLEGMAIAVQPRIGVARFPQHGDDVEALRDAASGALGHALRERRVVVVAAAACAREEERSLALTADLRALLRDGGAGLQLHYQPKADLGDGRIAGVEALVRWEHPQRGLLAPAAFLPLAEEHGLMGALTLAVLERALADQARWRAAGHRLPVAVNVAAANLLDGDFPADVRALLDRFALPAEALQLEITEGAVLGDLERLDDALRRLSEMGIALSLDDFGTGYSSLTRLKRMPVVEVKVDRSFVTGMLDDRDDAMIVRSTIDLARNLGLRVVAEGVETPEHWLALQRFGCHQAQGFLLSRPVPDAELLAWLQEREALGGAAAIAPTGAHARRAAARTVTDHDVLEAIMDAATAILGAGSLPQTLERIARQLRLLVPYDDLAVYEVVDHGRRLRAVHAEGSHVEEVLADVFSVETGITGDVVRHGRARNVPRTDLDPMSCAVQGTELDPEALVCVPLIVEGTVVGALNVYRLGADWPFSDAEAATIERLATLAALAFDSARQRDELRREARTDALTGLENYRSFHDRLRQLVDDGVAFTLAIVDLDHFKDINDSHGHDVGDQALREAAGALRAAVRAGDLVARLGGEEFGLLLIDGRGGDAVAALPERARAAVGSVAVAGRALSASAGTARFPRDGADADTLVRLADAALYRSKAAGRGRTTAHV